MDWYPQALLTALQAAAGVFFSFRKRHATFRKDHIVVFLRIFDVFTYL